jgi:hypothetical protein
VDCGVARRERRPMATPPTPYANSWPPSLCSHGPGSHRAGPGDPGGALHGRTPPRWTDGLTNPRAPGRERGLSVIKPTALGATRGRMIRSSKDKAMGARVSRADHPHATDVHWPAPVHQLLTIATWSAGRPERATLRTAQHGQLWTRAPQPSASTRRRRCGMRALHCEGTPLVQWLLTPRPYRAGRAARARAARR